MFRFASSVIRWAFRSAALLIFLIMLAVNVLTLTSSAVAALASNLLSNFGLETVVDTSRSRSPKATPNEAALRKRVQDQAAEIERQNERIRAQQRTIDANRGRVGALARNVSDRVAFGATRNVAATFAEGIPFFGVAAVVGITAWELRDACATMQDMKDISAAFEAEVDVEADEVCGLEVPSRQEVWTAALESPGAAWDKVSNVEGVDLPDFDFDIVPWDTIDYIFGGFRDPEEPTPMQNGSETIVPSDQ